jgi:hypothetical protein
LLLMRRISFFIAHEVVAFHASHEQICLLGTDAVDIGGDALDIPIMGFTQILACIKEETV